MASSAPGIRAIWRKIVEGKWADALVGTVGVPSGRRQQEALDFGRLALFTELWALRERTQRPPSHQEYQALVMQVEAMPVVEQRQAVSTVVQQQVLNVAQTLHEELLQAKDPAVAGASMAAACQRLVTERQPAISLRPRRTSQQSAQPQQPTTSTATATSSQPSQQPPPVQLSPKQVSELLQARLGYSLRVTPSSVRHPKAGQGVFMCGEAPVGSVVALLPGLVYQRTQLSRMPNYPQISLNNDYLSSTYDMTIIDSLPWKRECDSDAWQQQQHVVRESSSGGGRGSGQQAGRQQGERKQEQRGDESDSEEELEEAALSPAEYARWALSGLELRHPLALGHMVNHPGAGMHPNVLEVAWSMKLDPKTHPPWLRAYLPTAPGLDLDARCQSAAEALLKSTATKEQGSARGQLVVQGLALVATRTIKDGEEVLQNYRLSPYASRPDWYVSYDEEEERRRWAPLSYAKLL